MVEKEALYLIFNQAEFFILLTFICSVTKFTILKVEKVFTSMVFIPLLIF